MESIATVIGVIAFMAFATFFLFGEAIMVLIMLRMAWRQIVREAALLPQADRAAWIEKKHAELDASFKKKGKLS